MKMFFKKIVDEKFSSKVSNKIGELFFKLGYTVASNPWKTIFISLFFVFIFGLGILKLNFIKDPIDLWVPSNSKFRNDTKWLLNNLNEGHREESIIISAENVLEPKNLLKLFIINEEIRKIVVKLNDEYEITLDDICFKVPIASDFSSNIFTFLQNQIKNKNIIEDVTETNNDDEFDLDFNDYPETYSNDTILKRSLRNVEDDRSSRRPFNPSVDINSTIFCELFNKLPLGCRQMNLLEIWQYNETIIKNLTLNDILENLNKTMISPVTGLNIDFSSLLSEIKRDSNGKIISAKSLISHWYLKFNYSQVNFDNLGSTGGLEFWGTEESLAWEEHFLKTLKNLKEKLENDNFKIYYQSQRSFSDSIGDDIINTFNVFKISMILMFIFMQIVLSRFDLIEFRFYLVIAGLLSIGFGVVITSGICLILGMGFGPIQISFPLLLLGLGVDDMFVMMASYNSIEKKLPIPERMGLMLKQSGFAITITSVTDFIAFLVGSTTALNGIRYYCINSVIGIIIVYIYVVTFYIAVFALDERRIESRRNAFLPFIIHNEKKEEVKINNNYMDKFLKFIYSRIIFAKPGKVLVLIFTIILTGYSINNIMYLEKNTDIKWMIPKNSYLREFLDYSSEHFPNAGETAGIFISNINFTKSLTKIKNLSNDLNKRKDILSNFNSWIDKFEDFVKIYYNQDIYSENITDLEVRNYLSKFLFTSDNGIFQGNLYFDKKLKCGEPPEGNLKFSFLNFNFKKFEDDQNIYAMHELEHIVKNANIVDNKNMDSYATVWSNVYVIWSFIEIVDTEFYRNIIFSLICVMIVTFILILNLKMCIFILISVILTLINVGGFMTLLELNIDIIACLAFLLVIGLCVDYASHIGHTFLSISDGTKHERALKTVLHISAAIIYGAESTFVAMSMLIFSGVSTSIALIKYIMLIIIFGVFHGIIFLPVVLSIIGPDGYNTVKVIDTKL